MEKTINKTVGKMEVLVDEKKNPNALHKAGNWWDRLSGFVSPIVPYVKLQTILSFKNGKVMKRKTKVFNNILKVLVLAFALFFIFIFTRLLTSQGNLFKGGVTLIVYFTIAQIAMLIMSISAQIKRLYRPDDLKIISVFPLNSFQRYLGEILTIYIKLLIYSIIVFWPVLLIFGGSAQVRIPGQTITTVFLVQQPVRWIFSSLLAAFLTPLVPFGISLIISVPFMYLSSWLSNKNIVRIVLFVILFVAILIAYAFVLNLLADMYSKASGNKQLFEAIRNIMLGMNKPYNPSYYVSELCLNNNMGANFGYYCAWTVGTIALGIVITKPLYHKFTVTGSALESMASVRKVKVSNNGPYKELFVKELKQIVRTPTYAYFYLGVAVSMPVLTLLISELIKKLGQEQVGSNAFFGFELLVLLIIISLIGSYAANIISKEGKQFYITKIIPVPYRNQLLTKILVNFVVSFTGLILCVVVIGATSIVPNVTKSTPGITWQDLGFLFGISTLFLIGITFNGVMLELWRPKINVMGDQSNESNTIIQLIICFIVAGLLSVAIIVGDEIYSKVAIWIHIIALGLMLIYAVVFFLLFWFKSNKNYKNIEAK